MNTNKSHLSQKRRALFQCLLLSFSFFAFSSCSNDNDKYDASGVFEATEVIVSSEANGKILRFDVEEGQVLEADKTVGYIDSTQLYLQKMQLIASLKATQNRRVDIPKQIATIQQQITTAKTEQKRFENLVKSNAANQKQLDDINAQIALLEKQLAAQQSTLQTGNNAISEEGTATEVRIQQLEDQIRKCIISSPIKGTVLSKYVEQGELAAQGKALFKVADMDQMILRAYITSDQLTKVKLGQQVKVFADFGEKEEKEYAGVVTWISDKSEFTPKTIQTRDERANLVYAVKISVKNDGYLKKGMYGEIKFE